MYSKAILILSLVFAFIGTCERGSDEHPVTVTIQKAGNEYMLLKNNEPFYINGAGGHENLDRLADYGGNSIRTWSTDNARQILDEAHKHGIMVTMGLWVGHERHGFDYNDRNAVQDQLDLFRTKVRLYKDHPALLMWAVGNEMELNYTNTKVWDAVNDIALMIKEEDPKHPSMTVTAEIDAEKLQLIKEKAPAIDILGVNSYGGLGSLPYRIREQGWEKPYIVTEWGPNGYWEVAQTSWGAPIEPTSTEKARAYQKRYENVIATDTERCLGSYVFLWGQKQERTATWYSLFLDTGEETEAVDVMHYEWSGSWPANQAPSVESLTINGQNAYQNVRLERGKVGTGLVEASDPENDNLSYTWAISPESTDLGTGGDPEQRPDDLEGLIISFDNSGSVSFSVPEETGAYRLYVYIYDGNGNAGYANIPFWVN